MLKSVLFPLLIAAIVTSFFCFRVGMYYERYYGLSEKVTMLCMDGWAECYADCNEGVRL